MSNVLWLVLILEKLEFSVSHCVDVYFCMDFHLNMTILAVNELFNCDKWLKSIRVLTLSAVVSLWVCVVFCGSLYLCRKVCCALVPFQCGFLLKICQGYIQPTLTVNALSNVNNRLLKIERRARL